MGPQCELAVDSGPWLLGRQQCRDRLGTSVHDRPACWALLCRPGHALTHQAPSARHKGDLALPLVRHLKMAPFRGIHVLSLDPGNVALFIIFFKKKFF